MRIKLSDHFSYKKLIRFVIPSVCMMIFTSIYSVVDGFFVSNYAGKTPFAALNLIYPLLMMLAALGFMIGTGGSAVVSKALGEGKKKEANEYFSMLVYAAFIGGTVISILGLIFLRPIAIALGADKELLSYCLLYGRILLKTCTNGSSELMTTISTSLVNMLYNLQLMKLAGENGIAAYGVIMYVNFIFIAIFLGYSIGSAPIIGYNYGAENHKELKGILKKSLVITAVCGIMLTAFALLFASPLSKIFVGYDEALFSLTLHGFRLFSLSFLITGFNIFASSFFTALGNGFVSAFISFSRTLLFQIASVLLLPMLFGLNGIWLSIVVAEALAIIVTAAFLIKNKKRYHY